AVRPPGGEEQSDHAGSWNHQHHKTLVSRSHAARRTDPQWPPCPPWPPPVRCRATSSSTTPVVPSSTYSPQRVLVVDPRPVLPHGLYTDSVVVANNTSRPPPAWTTSAGTPDVRPTAGMCSSK